MHENQLLELGDRCLVTPFVKDLGFIRYVNEARPSRAVRIFLGLYRPSSCNVKTANLFFGLTNQQLAFLIARIGLGTNLFFHGIVRLPKLTGFVRTMETTFADSLLPVFMVTPMAYAIPVFEFAIGLMLLLGFATRWALVATALQMMVLVIGCCFTESWDPINSQMFLLSLAVFLIAHLQHNTFSATTD